MLIINDTHLSAKRQAGTTPASQAGLREFMFLQFAALLELESKHLCIDGDLFDKFEVEGADLIRTHGMLADWLARTGARLTMVCGNHDWSPKSDRVSSWHMLCHFLKAQFPHRVDAIDSKMGLTEITDEVWAVPHMPNTDLFDLEINNAVEVGGSNRFLLLHANCLNFFAEHSDHSLSVTEPQLDALVKAGWTVVFSHEHQGRVLKDGKVIVIGNQFPSSIADCLGNDRKFALRIEDSTATLVPVLNVPYIYAEVDWTNLDDAPDRGFLRVTGNATADQAAEVVAAVAKLRQKSDAMIVGNAVRIEGMADFEALAEMSFENITTFDVLGALCAELTEKEAEVVRGLLR